MIRRFRHAGLRRLYEKGQRKGVNPQHADLLEEILGLLDVARNPADLDIPGYRLHPLKGQRKGEWAVDVSRNWRVTFRFEGEDATDVNYEDYH